ncbi:hypothetical protein [Bacillus sp. UNC41MFS5]|nr:hypothetical protein [Bacillus sp. UNC41MFS5]
MLIRKPIKEKIESVIEVTGPLDEHEEDRQETVFLFTIIVRSNVHFH